jgi:DNA-binding transcriptional LysR family regulator
MDIVDLRTFEAVARHGSMNKAASELNTVQSNITARIRALEEELGIALFQRHARGVATTPAGQRVLPFATRITKLVSDARTAALDEGTPNGSLVLGALETTTALRLAPVLTEFSRRHASVRLVLNTGTTARLLTDVVESRLDGAFVAGPVAHPDLLQVPVFTEEMVLVTSTAIRSPKELAQIADLRTVVFQRGCSYRQRLEAYLAELGVVAARPLEFGSLDAIISCVSASVGVTLMPKGVVAEAVKAGRVTTHRLPASQTKVQTLFVRRTDSYGSSALTAFLQLATDFHSGKPALRSPSAKIRKSAGL